MSTYAQTDPCTDIILDFIRGGPNAPGNPSGEAAGNYNAVIGNARATQDLGELTLSQIYDLQDELVSHEPSSAVGGYQFIKKTLQSLQSQLNLPDDTKFTPATQDLLAVRLLVGRGYSAWWTGSLSDEDFAHGLSMEWASLPDPQNGGKSHYDGVGPNHASTTLEHVYAALSRARTAKQTVSTVPAQQPAKAPDHSVVTSRSQPSSRSRVMSLISNVISDALGAVNWMEKAQNSTTNNESLTALLIKTAIDGYKAATEGGSLLAVVTDIENDIAAYENARSANIAAPADAPATADPAPAA